MNTMLLLLLSNLLTQNPIISIPANTPLEISFQHDGIGQYRLWCDGAIVKNFNGSETTKVASDRPSVMNVTLKGASVTKGKHTCEISNFTPFLSSDGTQKELEIKSDSFDLDATGPTKPVSISVTYTIKIGG